MATSNVYLRKKIEERASQSAVLQSMQDQAAQAGRDLTEAERNTFKDITNRLEALDNEINMVKGFNENASKFVELVGAQNEAEERAERARDRNRPPETTASNDNVGKELAQRAAFGKRFVESTAFKSYNGSGTSARVELPGPASAEFRAALMTTDFDELPKQLWVGPPTPAFRTPLLDVLGRVAVTQAAVLYLYWPPPEPVAEVVPEGEPKPEAEIKPATATIEVETVAHWKGVTRQALEDIAQIRSIVQNKLLQGVQTKLEQLAAAALTSNTDIPTATGANLMEAIRVGIATVEAAGYTPNAILVNPADAATLDLSAMAASFSGPVRSGSAWGLPIVSANIIPAGTAYVGNFAQGVTWFDRGVTSVFVSDSHQDFFIRNILVILAEARAAFAVTEPVAMVKVTAEEPEPETGG
jgi:hypothetical protein